VKPVPFNVAPLIVTAAVPVAVNVTDCVAGVFTNTSPKATLVAFEFNVLAFSAAELLPAVVQPVMQMARKQASRIRASEHPLWGRQIGARCELPLKREALRGADSGFGEKLCKTWDM
jgi:hypothetical protein